MSEHEDDSIYYVNGSFCKPSEAKVSVLDRGFLFGDSIYEALRVYKGKTFLVADHYERLSNGLSTLKIPVPFTLPEYTELCAEIVRRNGVYEGSIYMQVTRGAASSRRHIPAAGMTPTVVAMAHAAEFPAWKKKYPGGVSAITTADIRWGRCNLKTTMLLPNTLAKAQADASSAYEAIFVAEDGTVREGGASTIVAVIDGTLRTHPLDHHILPSITRKAVVRLARENDVPLAETAFTLQQMRSADELFLLSTTNDVCPIVKVDGQLVADGKIGPVTMRMMGLFQELLERS